MRRPYFLALGAALLIAAIAAITWPDSAEPNRVAEPVALDAGTARTAPPAVAARRAPTPSSPAPVAKDPALPAAPSLDVDDYAEPAQLDDTYPGLAKAYSNGMQEARAAFLQRAQWRCALLLPDVETTLEWDALETFDPNQGSQIMSGLQFSPRAPGNEAFFNCMHDEMVGRVQFAAPEGFHERLQVHGSGRMTVNAAYTDAELRAEIEDLRGRLAEASLGDAKRKALTEHLVLYECYAQRGLARRRECLQELAGSR